MRLLCVVPRYGENVLGGAEALMRGFAESTAACGVDTHVLTTCATSTVTWANDLPAGRTSINGVPVWRYPIDPVHAPRRYQQLFYKIMTAQPLDLDEQYAWLDLGPHSPALYAHLQRHGAHYDDILFTPYLFPLVQYAASLFPERSVIWPCLHDEAFARFEATRLMLGQAAGLIFNSEPERELARRKVHVDHPHTVVAGIGVDDFVGRADRFRQLYNLSEPFILYAGRLEPPKNVPVLLDYFLAYKRSRSTPVKLVLMGEGTTPVPPHPDIVSIGFKQGQDKFDAYAAATILCQPSIMESFSIVIMESWLAGVPVLVHDDCAVTRYHCEQSNGGLSFGGAAEFAACLDWFLSHPAERAQLGRQGRAYVRRYYTQAAVTQRVLEALRQWQL